MNESKYVRACLDNSPLAPIVSDMGAWAARQLELPLELIHAIKKHIEAADPSDHSGTIGIDATSHLLEELAEQDTARSHDDRERGRALLERYRMHLESTTEVTVDVRMRWGNLDETVAHLQASTSLYVLGRNGESGSNTKDSLGSNLEATIRTLNVPVLIVAREAHRPTRVVYAFDGSAANRAGVKWISESPLLKGLPIHLIAAGPVGSNRGAQLEEAVKTLSDAGFSTTANLQQGPPVEVITSAIMSHHADLLVMGAYAHSKMSKLFRKSTTNAVLKKTTASALILRF